MVLRALQVSRNRTVALKMIIPGRLASPADVALFRAEVEAAGNLDHPNILPIYEAGEHAGQHYYTMKLIGGGNLGAWIRSGGSDPTEAVNILSPVARAVHHAHQRGILHRDLKPTNILLDVFGTPYLADLGLGRWLVGSGTSGYVSPEQARADRSLTTAADVWSLGALLYECLTGKPPYPGDSPPETVLAVMAKEPMPPRWLRPGLPGDLEAICLKCLQKEPRKRYASAGELADDLTRWLHDEPIQARPRTRWERAGKWLRRRPVVAAIAMAGTLLALVGVAGMLGKGRLAETTHEREHGRAAGEIEARRSTDDGSEGARLESKQVALSHHEKAIAELTEAMRRSKAAAAEVVAFQRRGEAHAMRGEWKEAGHDLDRALAIDPRDLMAWDHRLLVYLACGQFDDYRKTLAKMIDRFGRSNDQKTALALVLPCVRIPGAVDEVTLLRLGFIGTAPEARTPDQRLYLGAALYRANRPAAALPELQAAAKARMKADALDSLFMALSLRQLGRIEEARAALRRGVEIMDTAERHTTITWQQRISGETLRREVEALLSPR